MGREGDDSSVGSTYKTHAAELSCWIFRNFAKILEIAEIPHLFLPSGLKCGQVTGSECRWHSLRPIDRRSWRHWGIIRTRGQNLGGMRCLGFLFVGNLAYPQPPQLYLYHQGTT